ncbi:hypothetical protein TNCV_4728121 [Trichonephila clavipes]|nr:hypothetical protein TNCV_4728121 [Trichonephila clavipes]
MKVMCWFSGPAPQKNVGGMGEDYFVRAGVVVLGDGGHALVLRSYATNECGWNAGGTGVVVFGDEGSVLVLLPCTIKECGWNEVG